MLCDLWKGGIPFLVIEHDIVPTKQALRQARYCPCIWGISPYNGPGLDPLYTSLGFVRFRKKLMGLEPNAMAAAGSLDDSREVPVGHWRRLDARVTGVLRKRGYEPHVHSPVIQHHVYRGRCACLEDHEEFRVDAEGRFLA